ncbi:MAG TPA: SWIM zinc finger family protein [Planctomycetota bacterium]|nr:SWIM zinc finger family protein [Planctomycetota bacterium]
MRLDLTYYGRSRVERRADAMALVLAPNLARSPVSFEAELARPLRFREAVSSLHEIVVGDLRWKPKDHTAYRAWLKKQTEQESEVRKAAHAVAKKDLEIRHAGNAYPPTLDRDFKTWHKTYWDARRAYANELRRNDPELFRRLTPCDPVITVAPDVVFFECFSADESSYGCLTVERDAMFQGASAVQTGTTNVDYSWALFDHFQTLRTYRATRFHVDPSGFEVRQRGGEGIREEKIDLPESWLRGFLQIQAAMTLPSKKVSLDRDCVYSLLAYLKRHKAKRSPRALRFELAPGRPPEIVLEPWDLRAVSRNTRWDGNAQTIKVWGRQRLLVLARTLPLADGIDVYLMGDGLPSFWVVRMGEMRLTLGLSGWTVNDWTRASALDLMAPQAEIQPQTVRVMAEALQARQTMREAEFGGRPDVVRAALFRMARLGQSIQDLSAGVVRWRRVLPPEIAIETAVPENPESAASTTLSARVERDEVLPSGLRIVIAMVGTTRTEALFDVDGIFKRAKCTCSHFYKGGLKKGPCRHLLAVRTAVWRP